MDSLLLLADAAGFAACTQQPSSARTTAESVEPWSAAGKRRHASLALEQEEEQHAAESIGADEAGGGKRARSHLGQLHGTGSATTQSMPVPQPTVPFARGSIAGAQASSVQSEVSLGQWRLARPAAWLAEEATAPAAHHAASSTHEEEQDQEQDQEQQRAAPADVFSFPDFPAAQFVTSW